MNVNAKTQLCGVLGNPVEHSLSPAIHNAAFQELGLNYVYLAFRVEHLKEAIQGIRALGNLRGFSVTIPHKVAVIPFLDELDSTARHIGAINTIVKDGNRLKGTNTDATGALRALREAGVDLPSSRITLLGSGGAARAIAFGLLMDGRVTSLNLLGIDDDERTALARDLKERTGAHVNEHPLDSDVLCRTLSQSTLLVHCTPIGMHPNVDDTCVSKAYLHRDLTVMDIVYNPLDTRLLKDARAMGCRVIRGIEMFLYQAVAQFELWTGCTAPVAVMRRVLESQFQ